MGYYMTAREKIGDAGCLRLNIWSMGILRNILDRTGVLDWDSEPSMPEYPPDFAEMEEGTPEFADFQARMRAALAIRSTLDKVPAAKLCTNEGWLIVPAECRLLADALETRGWDALLEVANDPNGGLDSQAAAILRSFTDLGHIGPRMAEPGEDISRLLETWTTLVENFVAFCRRCEQAGGFEVW